MAQKEQKTVVLFRIEDTVGTDSIQAHLTDTPSPYMTDAMLVSAADVATTQSALERPNYNPSLDDDSAGVGRVLQQVTFTHELRGSGVFGVAPRLGKLLRACGFQETTIPNTAPAIIGTARPGPNNSAAGQGAVTKGAVVPTTNFDTYRVICSSAGKYMVVGSGFSEMDNTLLYSSTHSAYTGSRQGIVALGGGIGAPTFTFGGVFAVNDVIEVFVGGLRFYYQVPVGGTSNAAIATAVAAIIDPDARIIAAAAGAVITCSFSGAAAEQVNSGAGQVVTLGASGAQVTLPAAVLTVGDYYDIPLYRPGVRYDPITDNIPTASIYVYLDGTLHRTTSARGTFTVTANAGEYPTMAFTFTGQYNDPVDAPVPTVAFEQSKPYKVELAEAAVLGMPNVCAQSFTVDLGGTIEAKDCMNAPEATDELLFTDRKPTATVNPESSKPSVFSPWSAMKRGDTTRLHFLSGRRGGVGNLVRFQADRAQYTAAPYAVRTAIRAYTLSFALRRVSDAGNDSLFFWFG